LKEIEIFFKNLLLRLFLFLSRHKKNPLPCALDSSSKILLIRLNNIGDALVTTPFIKEIKEQTGCGIYVLASKRNFFIFSDNPFIDKVWRFDKGIGSFFSAIKRINKERFDAVIDLHDDVSATVSFIVALSKSPCKLGLERSNNAVFTQTIARIDPQTHHVIERNAELGKLLNLKIDNKRLNVIYNPAKASIKKAEEYLREKFETPKYLVGINISAGSDARFWGVENYKKLVEYFRQYNVNVILLTTLRDIKQAYSIADFSLPVYKSPSFDEFAAMIYKLDFLFSPDTSIIHLGSAFTIPVFGLYVKYNTQDIIWYPYKSPFECVVTPEPTLKNMSYSEVEEKLKPFFESVFIPR